MNQGLLSCSPRMQGEVVGLRSTASAGQTGASRPKRLRKAGYPSVEPAERCLGTGKDAANKLLPRYLAGLGSYHSKLLSQGGCPDNWVTGAAIGFTGLGLEQGAQ